VKFTGAPTLVTFTVWVAGLVVAPTGDVKVTVELLTPIVTGGPTVSVTGMAMGELEAPGI
jgi:hypothetical protein